MRKKKIFVVWEKLFKHAAAVWLLFFVLTPNYDDDDDNNTIHDTPTFSNN
jgi:hypothetical protein